MSIKCFYKPNRVEPRKFTEKDAARVLCYVAKGKLDVETIDFESIVDQFEQCGGEIARKAIEKFVKRKVCELFGERLGDILGGITRVLSFFRAVRLVIDTGDGFVTDLESFEIPTPFFTARIPKTLTDPLRSFIDRIQETFDTIENSIDSIISDLTNLLEGCKDGET